MTSFFYSLGACTSGKKIPGLVDTDEGCGHPLTILGYTSKRRLPVLVCLRCDAANEMRTTQREGR